MSGSTFARQLRKESTWAEKLVWRWLRSRRFTEYKFRRQYPIGLYILDLFCFEAKLSIELDGSQHGFPEGQAHDEARRSFLERSGIKELRFWNSQLKRNPHGVRATIFRELQERAPHSLPGYVTTLSAPHPSPLPKGEGEEPNAVKSSVRSNNRELSIAPPLLGERAGVRGPLQSKVAHSSSPSRIEIRNHCSHISNTAKNPKASIPSPSPRGEGRGEGPL